MKTETHSAGVLRAAQKIMEPMYFKGHTPSLDTMANIIERETRHSELVEALKRFVELIGSMPFRESAMEFSRQKAERLLREMGEL